MPGFVAGRACLCYSPVCPRIRRGGSLNVGILGSVHWWLPGWQEVEWEQKNMSGRALVLQIGSEMAPRPFTGRVNWTLIKHSEGCTCQRAKRINPVYKRPPGNQYPTETLTHAITDQKALCWGSRCTSTASFRQHSKQTSSENFRQESETVV